MCFRTSAYVPLSAGPGSRSRTGGILGVSAQRSYGGVRVNLRLKPSRVLPIRPAGHPYRRSLSAQAVGAGGLAFGQGVITDTGEPPAREFDLAKRHGKRAALAEG